MDDDVHVETYSLAFSLFLFVCFCLFVVVVVVLSVYMCLSVLPRRICD